MKKHRRKHSAEFKASVALEAIKGIKTLSEIAKEYDIHPVMVGNWKKEMLDRLPEIFSCKKDSAEQEREKEQSRLHQKVGQLSMEVDFLEKKCRQLGIPVKDRS